MFYSKQFTITTMLKQFICLTIIVAIATALEGEIAPVPFSVRALKPQPVWPCRNANGWSCQDCNSLQYCNNGSFEYKITCGVQFPGQNYCNPDTSTCTSNRDSCQEIETGMICPAAGLFPDITDCSKYISCTRAGEFGISYNCMFNSIYNHSQKRCTSKSDCYNVSFDCADEFKAIPFKPDDRYFVICRGPLKRPMLKDCGKDLVFNALLMDCEFQCKYEGNFANPRDPTSYYICAYNGDKLVRHQADCVPGTIFNEATGNCIYAPLS